MSAPVSAAETAAPIAFFRGPEHVCEWMTPAMVDLLPFRCQAGMPLLRSAPGEDGQVLARGLDQVWRRGTAVALDEFAEVAPRARLRRLVGQPVRDADGRVIGAVICGDPGQADRLKDEFIARVSHELSTPLSAMKMWIRLLRMDRQRYYESAMSALEQCSNQQAKILGDLLDISRSISGKLRLDLQPVDLNQVIQGAVTAMRPQAEEHGLGLRADLPGAPVIVRGDETRLRQVLLGLLSNAISFTPEGGRIEVRLVPGPAEASVAVSDSGAGIGPEVLPHLFEPFYQAGSPPRGGLGLGLAVAHRLVGLHGGTVTAASPGPGQGATFTVTLPLWQAAAGRDEMDNKDR